MQLSLSSRRDRKRPPGGMFYRSFRRWNERSMRLTRSRYRNPDDGLFSVSSLFVVELDVSFRDRVEHSVLLGYQSLRNRETCCTVVSKEISLHRIELRRARRGFRVAVFASLFRRSISGQEYSWGILIGYKKMKVSVYYT